jgi:hypothetical protein
MKKLLLIVMAVTGLVACKKTKVSPTVYIVGKWELHRKFGGNIQPTETTYQAGNGNILQFNADSTYKTYSGGTVVDEGAFKIYRHAYKSGNMVYDELYFASSRFQAFVATMPDIVILSGTMLSIKPTMPDASTMEYNKISN